MLNYQIGCLIFLGLYSVWTLNNMVFILHVAGCCGSSSVCSEI
jgi:hypothetical protein